MEPYTQTFYYFSMMQPISKTFGNTVPCDIPIKKFSQVCRWYLTCGENGETKP